MWFLNLLVKEDKNLFNVASEEFNTQIFIKPDSGYEEEGQFAVRLTGYMGENQKDVHNYFLRHDKITHYEYDGNYFFCEYRESLSEDRVKGLRYAYDSRLIHVKPVKFTPNGWEEWFVSSVKRKTVSNLITASEELGVEYEVKVLEERLVPSVFSFHPSESLTSQQRRVISIARRLGYFEVPRQADISDIAKALDVARSTAHEHLTKAVSKILDQTHL